MFKEIRQNHGQYFSQDDPLTGGSPDISPPGEQKKEEKERIVTRILPLQMRSLEEVKTALSQIDAVPLSFTSTLWTVKNSPEQYHQVMMLGGHSDKNETNEEEALRKLWNKGGISGIQIGKLEILTYQNYEYPHNGDTRKDHVFIYVAEIPPFITPFPIQPRTDKVEKTFAISPPGLVGLFDSCSLTDPATNVTYTCPDNLRIPPDKKSGSVSPEMFPKEGVIFLARYSPQAAQQQILDASADFETKTAEIVMRNYLENVFRKKPLSGQKSKQFEDVSSQWKKELVQINGLKRGEKIERLQTILHKTFQTIRELYPSGSDEWIRDFSVWYEHTLFERNVKLIEHTGPQKAFIIGHSLAEERSLNSGSYERVEHEAPDIFTPLFDTAWTTFVKNAPDKLITLQRTLQGKSERKRDSDWLENTRSEMAALRRTSLSDKNRNKQITKESKERELMSTFLQRLKITREAYDEIEEATDNHLSSIMKNLGETDEYFDKNRSLLERFLTVFNVGEMNNRGEITKYEPVQRWKDWAWLITFMTYHKIYPQYKEKMKLNHEHFNTAFVNLTDTAYPSVPVNIDKYTYKRNVLKQSLMPSTLRVEISEEETRDIPLPKEIQFTVLDYEREKNLESFGRKYLERGDEGLTKINDYFGRQICLEVDDYLDRAWDHLESYGIPRDTIRTSLSQALVQSILGSYKEQLEKEEEPLVRFHFNKKGIFKTFNDIPQDDNYNGGSGAGNFSDEFDFYKLVQTSHSVPEELQILLDPSRKIEDDKRYGLQRILYPARDPAGNFSLIFLLCGPDKEFYEKILKKHLGD